ncbi:MAG: putative oxidoreductase, partial [Devosia sp.]|nr:putative oxidoreductase [Devosia sp.]
GGMVSWVAAELLRQGLVDGVAHVAPESPQNGNGFFRYRVSRDLDGLRAGAKSRYYPVDMAEVIREIRAVPGRYAVVGIPCFIKAVNLLREEDPILKERIVFVLGLFCGHMKSARMIESFAWQMGAEWSQVEKVEYRLKNPERPANWYTAQLTQRDGGVRTQDWWHLVDGDWGSGFFMNSACNWCDDVVAETADIAFGDAWLEPYSSDGRGTNVVIVRSPLVHRLVQNAMGEGRLDLKPVDHEFVVQTQAAGFRQRREGLAYRLSWPKRGVRPKKRVAPSRRGIAARRKLIYLMRYGISAWSHRMAWLAKRVGQPRLFIGWGRAALALYHGAAYGRGRIGKLVDKLKIKGEGG